MEIIVSKNKILLQEDINHLTLNETKFTTTLESIISKLSNKYEKLILMGDFDMIVSCPILSQFLETFALSSLNIDPACFKNSKNTSQSFAYKFQTEFDEF